MVAEVDGRRTLTFAEPSRPERYRLVARLLPQTRDELLVTVVAPAVVGPLVDTVARLLEVEDRDRIATTDVLTGLKNRLAFERAWDEARRTAADVRLLMLDLDGFKGINDHFGHAIGDVALVEVGRALLANQAALGVRAFRTGGDEFVIWLDADNPAPPAEVGARIRDVLEGIWIVVDDDEELPVRTSFGAGVGNAAIDEVEALLAAADEAMYADKQARPDRLPRGARPRTWPRGTHTAAA